MLTVSDGVTNSAAQLSAGTYTVYAVGGNNMSCFTLPEQNEANAKSEIGLASGKGMDDLLMKEVTVPLGDSETHLLELTLERKVMRIDQVTIKNVPEGVTGVEVRLAPLYKKIYLDGTYPTETGYESVELTKDTESTEGEWYLSKEHYCFPASTKPTITVCFTVSGETKSYSYTAAEDLPANHKLKIVGTYTQTYGVELTGVLSGTDWGEDITITFDFDENNNTASGNNNNEPAADAPVQGSTYLGCYVVSVDQDAKTAVLLSPTKKGYLSVIPNDQEASLGVINSQLSSWTPVSGVSGTWRIPTVAEAQVFLADTEATSNIGAGQSYFCLDGTELVRLYVQASGGVNTVTGPFAFIDTDFLRPVIDITY